jgi:carboxylesterase type B
MWHSAPEPITPGFNAHNGMIWRPDNRAAPISSTTPTRYFPLPFVGCLFAHATAESGCLQPSQNQQQAERHDASFAAQLGCTGSQSRCPALATDTLVSRSGVYAYEFSDPDPPDDFAITFGFPLGDAHTTELQYVFGKIPYLDVTPPFTAAQFALSAQMMKYWGPNRCQSGSTDGSGTGERMTSTDSTDSAPSAV